MYEGDGDEVEVELVGKVERGEEEVYRPHSPRRGPPAAVARSYLFRPWDVLRAEK